jgi:hypothetical protein
MPSDIFIKTASGWATGLAKKIFIKTASSTWSAAKSVFLFFDAGWTKVWPLSGVYATRNPFVSTTSSTSELSEGTVLRVGATYRGNRGTWNPNGYTITSYQYKWVAYSYQDTGDLTTNYDPSLSTLSGTTNDFLITGTNYDRSWMTFFVTAKASGGIAYDGSAESLRYYIVRRIPRLSAGTSPSFNNNSPKVDDIISYSSSWDVSDAYRPEAARTTIKWYRNSSATTTGGIEIQSSGYSYTVKEADIDNYIYAVETTFNSGSDYDLGTTTGVSATAITSSPAQTSLITPGPLTVTSSSTVSSWSLDITFGTNTTRAEIEYGSSTSYGFSGAISSSGIFTPVGPFASDTLYYYRVTPYNVSKAGAPVSGSIRTKVLVTKPGPARSVTIDNVAGRNFGEGQVLIQWLPPLDDGNAPIDYYRVQYAYDYDVSTWYTLSDTWTESPMYAGPFSDGYTVRAKVFAHNSEGYSVSEVSPPPGTYINTKAEPLTVLSATRLSSTSIRVSFTPSILYGGTKETGGSNVIYYLRTSSSLGTTSRQVTTSPFTITGLTAGYEYQVFIRASNDQGVADSNSIYVSLINPPAIIPGQSPSITPSSGTAGVTTYSVTNGGWTGSPTGYTYLWTYQETPSIFPAAPGVNNQSTYTPPSNYVSLYGSTLRCTVTATNAGGSTPANSGNVSVSAPVVIPTNSSAPTLSGTAQAGQTVTFGVGSWNNFPTSYSLRLYRGTRFVSQTETLVKDAGNVTSSSYVIQPGDVGFYLRAFATATNSAGTSDSGTYTGGQEIGPIAVAQVAPTDGTATVTPAIGTAGLTTYTASTSGWSGTPTISYSYAWQGLNRFGFYWETFSTQTTFAPTVAQNSNSLAWQLVVTASNGISPNGVATKAFTVNAPIIPTISMSSNTGITQTSGTINWTSTNQNTWSSNGTFSGSGSSEKTLSKTGLTAGTTYTGTVTVTSSTGNTASANYSLTTTAALSVPSNTSQPTLSGGLAVGSTFTFGVGSWSGSPTSYDLRLYRGTPGVITSETLVKSAGNVTSSTYVIPQSDFDDSNNRKYYRAFASATNAAGTSNSGTLTPGQELGPITSAPATPAPVLSTITGNNSLAIGGTFSWSFTNSPTSYSVFCTGPTGTVFTTSNAYTYTGATFSPGYDGTGWQGSGEYTIYVSARNAGGDSAVAQFTRFMS